MSELRALLAETTSRVLAQVDRLPSDEAWAKVDEAVLCNVMVAEDKGGFGGGWVDAHVVIRAAGAHATALPIPEAVIANRLISEAELILPDGMPTISPRTKGRVRRGKFQGEMDSVPFGDTADSVVAIVDDGNGFVLVVANRDDAEVVAVRTNPAGEPRASLKFADSKVQAAPFRSNGADLIRRQMALARGIGIAGALQGALALSANYVRERHQFGRPLANFQAIQQQLAVFAEEAAAALAASTSASHAADRGEARFEIGAAKLRCNRAAAMGAAIAHQVHGAMGFTAEYALQKFTRRLWAWRSEFGNDRHWENELGGLVAERGADRFWPSLVESSFGL